MAFDSSGKLVSASQLERGGARSEKEIMEVEDKLDELLRLLPEALAAEIAEISACSSHHALLMEIVLDLGRWPVARYLDGRRVFLGPEAQLVSQAALDTAVQQLGAFGSGNRAGVPGTLHRISAMRDRDTGTVLGLTYRVGRAVLGCANLVQDVLERETGGNVLILVPPMTGKTTIIRDMARLLSRDNWVVIVDTSNEIAGAGAVPHSSIGNARRMQVNLAAAGETLKQMTSSTYLLLERNGCVRLRLSPRPTRIMHYFRSLTSHNQASSFAQFVQ
jgi:stage III sporulation protein SpoIIIAA